MSKIDLNYEMEKIVENVVEMKSIINEMYKMEKMVFCLSFENGHENNNIVRLDISNSIGNTFGNNGLIRLIHKVYYVSELENFNENEILIDFFNIQKELKDFNLKYEISDNRKENE